MGAAAVVMVSIASGVHWFREGALPARPLLVALCTLVGVLFLAVGLHKEGIERRIRRLAAHGRGAEARLDGVRRPLWRNLLRRRGPCFEVRYRFRDEGGFPHGVVGFHYGQRTFIRERVTVVYDPRRPEVNVTLTDDPGRYRWFGERPASGA